MCAPCQPASSTATGVSGAPFFGGSFARHALGGTGLIGDDLTIVQMPYQAPNANAYAERFVRSIKEECLSRVIPFGDRHLRRTIAEFVEHYDRERNHQGHCQVEAVVRRAARGSAW